VPGHSVPYRKKLLHEYKNRGKKKMMHRQTGITKVTMIKVLKAGFPLIISLKLTLHSWQYFES